MRILLATDSHLDPDDRAAEANWQAVRDFAGRCGADLTIHLGDVVSDGFGAPEQFTSARAVMADWPTPLRFLPGNHDIGDNPPGPEMPSKHPLRPERLADYSASFGPDHWAFGEAGWWLIGLNAQLFGTGLVLEAAQWGWLEARLSEAAGRPVAFFLHKPLFQDGPEDAEPHIRYVPLIERRRLMALLAKVDLRCVLSGHTHQYRDRMFAGVRHLWLPATCYCFPESLQQTIGEKILGLGLLELNPDACRFDLIRPDGMTERLYRH